MPRKKKVNLARGILLSESDLQNALKKLQNWKVEEGKLQREYQFESFTKAFGFIASTAILSESMNHKLEFSSFDRRVIVRLDTPAEKGISTIDVLLAKKLDDLL